MLNNDDEKFKAFDNISNCFMLINRAPYFFLMDFILYPYIKKCCADNQEVLYFYRWLFYYAKCNNYTVRAKIPSLKFLRALCLSTHTHMCVCVFVITHTHRHCTVCHIVLYPITALSVTRRHTPHALYSLASYLKWSDVCRHKLHRVSLYETLYSGLHSYF
jgi:hypothetical protein